MIDEIKIDETGKLKIKDFNIIGFKAFGDTSQPKNITHPFYFRPTQYLKNFQFLKTLHHFEKCCRVGKILDSYKIFLKSRKSIVKKY